MDYESFDEDSLKEWNQRMYLDIARTMLLRTGAGKLFSSRRVTLLDAGCGTGGFAAALCALLRPEKVILVDERPEALALARPRFESLGIETETRAEDVADLALPPQSVDLILSRGSIRFWKHRSRAIAALARSLSAGGIAYLGGGRGSAAFQKEREAKDPDYSLLREEAGLQKASGTPWSQEEMERLFCALSLTGTFFQGEGDGRWIFFQRKEKP